MDILTWVEAFNSYAAVLNSYFPHRARDLSAYMALIIRTAKRFGGRAWLQYDRAFRREAEASFLQDWSAMKPDLYNYYTAAHGNSSSPLHAQTSPKRFRREPRGSPESRELCISWNQGRCVSPREDCRFRHACNFPGCTKGDHRRVDVHSNSISTAKRKRSPERFPRSRRATSQ